MELTMKFLECQNYKIPMVFVTALSYAKQCNSNPDYYGRVRFVSFTPAEISVRFEITRQRCEVIQQDFATWCEVVESWIEGLSVKTAPAPFLMSGMPLYSSLLFGLVSVNASWNYEGNEVIGLEVDAVFSGVLPSKEASRDKVLTTDEPDIIIPAVKITVNGVELESSEVATITDLNMTESSCDLSMAFGDATKILSRDVLEAIHNDNNAKINIDGYGDFYIIESSLVDDELSIKSSKLPITYNKTYSKTYNNSKLDFPELSDQTNNRIKYLAWHGTQSERLKQLQQAFGFLIDFHEMTINNIPDKLISNTDFSAYVNNDLITENITKVVWQDGLHTYEAGSEGGAVYGIDSPCTCDDASVAERCLKYYKYQQNYISITIPYDPRIRHHSVINVIKNATSIPCMVEKYNIDFFTNKMELECHWI